MVKRGTGQEGEVEGSLDGIFNGETVDANSADGVKDNTRQTFDTTAEDNLGLGYFFTTNGGGGYLTDFIEAGKNLPYSLKKNGVEFKTSLYKLDRTVAAFSNMAFDYLMVASTVGKTTYYHILTLEATGDGARTVAQMLEDGARGLGIQSFYVTPDAYDVVLEEKVIEILSNDLPGNEFISTNGLIVPSHLEPGVGAEMISKAMNANLARWSGDSGKLGVLDLAKFLASNTNSTLSLDITKPLDGTGLDEVGKTISSDFSLSITQQAGKTQSVYMNRKGGSIPLLTNSGYVEYIPKSVALGMGVTKKSILPNLIINSTASLKPTLDMIILSAMSTTVFANQAHLADLLVNLKGEIGSLNYITNIENDASGYGSKPKLKSGKIDQSKVMDMISKMFEPSPVISVEVDIYGPNFDAGSSFAGLNDTGLRQTANDNIVATCEQMLNTNITNRDVSINEGIVIPIGHWVDGKGNKRDIRDVNLAFVLAETTDPNVIYKWIMSNVPKSVSGQDPYISKLEVFNALHLNATITGKAVRLTLNSAFLAEIAGKAASLGFNPKTDAVTAGFNQTNDLSQIGSVYANAGLTGVNFGQSYGGGSNFHMNNLKMFGTNF